eukprot:COSAG05_NODE_970_length_6377_cov_10.010513_1_plen_82_part_00
MVYKLLAIFKRTRIFYEPSKAKYDLSKICFEVKLSVHVCINYVLRIYCARQPEVVLSKAANARTPAWAHFTLPLPLRTALR